MMRVLVCGGRDYNDYENVCDVLARLDYRFHDDYFTIVQGGARGADALAKRWAIEMHVPYEEYKADWDKHGKSAGFIRNQEMLDTGIDLVVAFPGGNGTAHTVRNAHRMGIMVVNG